MSCYGITWNGCSDRSEYDVIKYLKGSTVKGCSQASQPPNVTHWVATLRKLTKKTFPKYRAILCRERPDMVITSKDDDMLK